jgi:hypothetical protein
MLIIVIVIGAAVPRPRERRAHSGKENLAVVLLWIVLVPQKRCR